MHRMTFASLLVSATLAGSGWAHSPLDDPDWCTENGRLVVVDEFEWDGETLTRSVQELKGEGSCSPAQSNGVGTRTCGQFDDDWGNVNALAARHCDRYAVHFEGAPHPDHGSVIHIAEGPEAFNDEERHHDRYRARMGLHAVCIRCEPAVLEPVEPAHSATPVR